MNPLRNRLKNVRDASLSYRLGVSYEKKLDALFVDFKRDTKKILGVRQFAAPDPTATKIVDAQLRRSMEITITIPGKRIAKASVDKAYTAGGIRSTQFLNAMGVVSSYSRTPTDQKTIDILEQRNFSGLDGITDEMSKNITRTITDDVLAGKGVEKIARDIDEDIDGIGRTRARVLARTETMYAFNTSAKVQYDKMGVEQVEWYTSHLENVCDDCDALDGQKFEIDAVPPCPLHPNCPCILLPVIETGVKG